MSIEVSSGWPARAGDVFDPNCPSRGVLEHVTSRWGVLVLAALAERELRFGALHRRIGGVSQKMLAQTLRALAADGFVERTVVPAAPPQVSYRLTDTGEQVAAHVAGLVGWIERQLPRILAAREAAL
ncbi:winged helix-turn-helix transcriptional regulator [Jiangella alba]|uniref:DNA-binding transcriptional regulator, HxlR family n=1 Tax=Jiangella alba TaxID=561176 RepID=A0A1H5PZ07_9ACTN|nr:helix-turn-helix domain-containing protein [Jiangella alba]SEF18421.1 DNA-binding transcriptional regulator, HxlR family [Jiangella alba]